MSASTTSAPTPLARFAAWLPTVPDRRVRVIAWLNFIGNVVIIATGGAVRLTGSGLGCPTWPLCTADSLVPVPGMEEGYHKYIEFGNRMMSPVLGILALLLLVLVWRMRQERRDLFVLSWIVMGGIIAQALVGGITVWTGLNPFIVGFHYVASLTLVCITAVLLWRVSSPTGPRERAVPTWYLVVTHVATLAMAVSVIFGVLTTGAGPHSGDDDVLRRNGFDATLLEHIHAWPGYVLFALTLVLAIAAWRQKLPTLRWVLLLLGVELVQIAVGLYQARNGLPPLAVGVHMVLASLTAAAMVTVVMSLKRPVATTPLTAQA